MNVFNNLRERFLRVRALTEALAGQLSDADASAQAMADASPAKWHLAHTSWFFETFVLRQAGSGYQVFDERYNFLFNSYYEAEGMRLARASRGVLTRPALAEILAYRQHVTAAVLKELDQLPEELRHLVELGCHHEEQHQELLLTDILYLFAQNPLEPSVWPVPPAPVSPAAAFPSEWIRGREGLVETGHAGAGFAFDCEGPRHQTWLPAHALASRPVSNAEWREFVRDFGYRRAGLWLADGWAWVQQNRIEAPLYWHSDPDGRLLQFGLGGWMELDPHAPVCHVSYYEADAFARWAGARLPTEAEWESAAARVPPLGANFLDAAGPVAPRRSGGPGMRQLLGDVWEWTASPFLAYPGFRLPPGAIGEYNGKFMSGQFVLRGGSCATPRGHVRDTYRNFFYPHQRWQFAGVRLAKDL